MNYLLDAPTVPGSNVSVTVGKPAARGEDSNGIVRPLTIAPEAYDAASRSSQELSTWNPRLASADSELLGVRDRIVARSRHLVKNSGWAFGGVDKRTDMVVGAKLWLRARPEFAALGMSAEWAAEWSTQVESQFRLWGSSTRFLCDVERHHHFGGLIRLAYQHYIVDGEASAALYFLERGGPLATSVLIVDPDRLGNPDGRPDDKYLRKGVQLDANGAAIGYWVRDNHESDIGPNYDSNKFTYFPRETNTGRPIFIHVFNKNRAHMRRGIGRLSTVMSRMKMLDRYDATEIQAAITNAIFGLFAKTQRSSDAVRESMAPVGDDEDFDIEGFRANWYDNADISFNGVRLAVLPDGDDIGTITPSRPATNFKAFQRAVLNSVASAMGISGEQLSNDWEGINYSSARTLLNEIWRGLLADRHLFTQSFATPIYAAVLEELVARDLIEVPGGKAMFYIMRDALCQCDWIGPGRGYIDPKKESDATDGRIGNFSSNLPDEAAEQGNDWQHNLWMAKRVEEQKRKYGLVSPDPKQGGTGNAGGDDDSNSGPDQDQSDRQETEQSRRAE